MFKSKIRQKLGDQRSFSQMDGGVILKIHQEIIFCIYCECF